MRGDPPPDGLVVGSRIVRFGTLTNPESVEGGGLVIEYVRQGGSEVERIVFGFNEGGMWVESQSP